MYRSLAVFLLLAALATPTLAGEPRSHDPQASAEALELKVTLGS